MSIEEKKMRADIVLDNNQGLDELYQQIETLLKRSNPRFTIFIGSVSGSTGGYFACTSHKEINDTIDNLMRRAYQIYEDCKIYRSKEVIEFAKR